MLYVAYGSNLNLAQMSYRCPNAKIYTTGFLKGWKLIFRGSMNNSYATITESSGSIVPVLVWEITKSDERRLDIYEGFPKYYKASHNSVHRGIFCFRNGLYYEQKISSGITFRVLCKYYQRRL